MAKKLSVILKLKHILSKVKQPAMLQFVIMQGLRAPVAHLDRVLVSEAKGSGFDSRRAHQTHIYL